MMRQGTVPNIHRGASDERKLSMAYCDGSGKDLARRPHCVEDFEASDGFVDETADNVYL